MSNSKSNGPKLRAGFAGSPDFAATVLQNMITHGYTPQAVWTQPDRPKGRGKKLQPNPVKAFCSEHSLTVYQPENLKDEDNLAPLRAAKLDVLVVAAYGLILPKAALNAPKLGCINVHASLLPRWRGAAPIERAAIAGDMHTGVGIMQMEKGLDTGPVYTQSALPIDYSNSITELEDQLANLGGILLCETLDKLAQSPNIQPTPQADVGVTYAEKLNKADRTINWQQSAQSIQRRIWALQERLPVRMQIAGLNVQILGAKFKQQTDAAPKTLPGCVVDVSKHGVVVQCATDLLQITEVRVEKGKGSRLDPAALINGYGDYFAIGNSFVPLS